MNPVKKLNNMVEVSAWVLATTYILCWAFAVALVVAQLIGHIEYRPLLIGLAVYLLLWPVFQISPAEMLKRIFPG